MNIVTLVRSYLFVVCLTILPACANRNTAVKEQEPSSMLDGVWKGPRVNDKQENAAPWITVWIHGTQPSFYKIPGQRLRQLFLQKALDYFYCHQGLHHVDTQPKTNRHRSFAQLLNQTDALRFPMEQFYTFGWSGDLNFLVRQEAGRTLYLDLIKLVETFTAEHGVKPNIRIITHSHGGNVALNLALAEAEYAQHLSVNELILLACPIQDETACLAQDPLFKRIYSFYSSIDMLQVLDPQGLYKQNKVKSGLFSGRRFPTNYTMVAQAKVHFGKRPILHIEFLSDQFVQTLPHLISILEAWHQSDIHDQRIKQIHIPKDTTHSSNIVCSYASASQ